MGEGKYIIIAGAGKVGWNLARELLEKGNEVTVIEDNRNRFATVAGDRPEAENATSHSSTCPRLMRSISVGNPCSSRKRTRSVAPSM